MKRARGFSLIEVLIAVAIVGILAAIAFPNYQNHIRKGRRADAQSFMMDLANRQAQYMLDARTYALDATFVTTLGATTPESVATYYTLTVTPAAPSTPPTFTIHASPFAGGWVDGWTVTDSGGNMVGKQDKWTQVDVAGPGTVSFNGMGRLVGPATQFQLSSGELTNDKWRCLKLDISGRPVSLVGGCP